MKELLKITGALGDESRVRIIMFLRKGELCVCQIVALLRLAPSTISKHLAILEQAGLVESRKQERWVYYHLSDKAVSPCVSAAIQWVCKCVGKDKQTLEDSARLKTMLKMSLQKLCERYHK
jgi:ArsR family transcriptional regulator